MLVIPAIDIRGGKCVRLLRGDYDQETVYDDNPVAVARRWRDAGAQMIHIVDLDGARDGAPTQRDTIAEIVKAIDVPVQVGGGIRSGEHARFLIDLGVARIVVGTAAVEHPTLVHQLLEAHSAQQIVVGIDARNGYVATHGWLDTSSVLAVDLAREMMANGVRRFVYTDIDRDGTLTSPNFEAIRTLTAGGIPVIASGGVATLDHLRELAGIPGVEATIVGRALYTGDVMLHSDQWIVEGASAATEG
ncbi:MAG: 1-(5-phosphoribosyl)-5-[(5-phosphoribosylamino)methylideneamino]imidazole-4-carboxamide isomerase [Chloroflexota bacterium]